MQEEHDAPSDAHTFARTFVLHTQAVKVTAQDARGAEVARFVCSALAEHDACELDSTDARAAPPRARRAPVPVIEVPADLTRIAPAADALMQDLVQKLVWTYADGLALHTAAVTRGERVLLFPASSGTGKSTLAVHLALHGFGFLTDELVFSPLTELGLMHALPRPAHLKPGSGFVIEAHPSLRRGHDDPHVLRYEDGALLAPSALHASAPHTPRPLGAIVFPGYAHDARAELERLSSAHAAHKLLGALINARNLPGLGVAPCARLAASVPCYAARYRTLEEAQALLERVDIER